MIREEKKCVKYKQRGRRLTGSYWVSESWHVN